MLAQGTVTPNEIHFIGGPRVRTGTGTPNGTIVGSVGDVWIRTDGGQATAIYIKESGSATNTGWTGMGASGAGQPAFNAGNSSTALTLDWTNGNNQKVTLTGNVTFTLNNPLVSGMAVYRVLLYTGAGSFTATWPASVHWLGGSAPTITVTAARMDLVTFVWDSTVSEYFASIQQTFTP